MYRVFSSLLTLLLIVPGGIRAEEPTSPPITLHVDATEFARNLIHVKQTMAVKPGPLTLLYPRWIPGNHGPTGPIDNLTGLQFKAGDTVLTWKRNDADPYAFHLNIPPKSTTLTVTFDLLGAGSPSTSTFGTPRLGIVNWNQVLLYPESKTAMQQPFQASLVLPEGWKFGTALSVAETKGNRTTFKPVSMEELIDSPLLSGRYIKEIPLGAGTKPAHSIVLVSDSEEGLKMPAEYKKALDRLVVEGGALFGSRPYRSYRFLLTLSDQTGPSGLEHHESSDNRLPERAMLDETMRKASASLLPHEFVHAWNGKYRRPADMVVDDFQKPHRTRLLWVYEGLTEYLGYVLTARCGLLSADDARAELAMYAEMMNNRKGRNWRPLEDTAAASHTMRFRRGGWTSRQRTVGDYYLEGLLLWLEVDTLIRQKTDGKKSLDDFCKRFYAFKGTRPVVKPYTLEDVVADLNAVVAHDWKAHLIRRTTAVTESAPLEGVTQGGWKLTYAEKPSSVHKASESMRKYIDYSSSLGLTLKPDNSVLDVIPDRPADKAGLAPGMKLVAVNGRRFTPARLSTAVAATKDGGKVELLTESGDFFRTYTLSYKGGLKYPQLERISESEPDYLGAILRSKAK